MGGSFGDVVEFEIALPVWVCCGEAGDDVLDCAGDGDFGATGGCWDVPVKGDDFVGE